MSSAGGARPAQHTPANGQPRSAAHSCLPPPPPCLQVVQQEGVLSLWKGNGVTILHRLPYSAINFSTYEHSMALLARMAPHMPDASRRFTAGSAAAVVACTAAYPLDLVRTRLAAQTSSR